MVETLWTDPTTMAQLRRAADTYTTRREAMIAALKRHHIAAYGRSGLNVWVPVPEEIGIVTNLAAAGWAVRGGERYRIKSPPAVRISIAALQQAEANKLAADFAQCLQPQRSTHSV
jgi:DNA-binding transcriptional MocR family regulator